MFYLDSRYIDITFTCNRKLSKLSGFQEEKYDGNKAIVQVAVQCKKKVHINCWLNDRLLFAQCVDYIPDQRYSITCKYQEMDKDNPIRKVAPTHDMEKDPRPYDIVYSCVKELHPKVAKKWYKELRKNNLVSKPYWDSYMSYYDHKCLCCEYSWVGNPDIGYVREVEYYNKIHKPIAKYLKANGVKVYRNRYYHPCRKEEYDTLDFYNQKEWEEYRSKYAPTRKYTTYLNKLEYYTKIERFGLSNFEDLGFDISTGRKATFEEFADKWGFDYRVCKEGTDFEIGDILHECQSEEEEACTEKVVNFDWPRYKIRFPSFSELWAIDLTQEEIDKNGNSRGGAYRLFETHLNDTTYKLWDKGIFAKDQRVGEKDWDELIRLGVAEKVVADMVHSTKPKSDDVVECPVCRDLNKILCHSGFHGTNIFQSFREDFSNRLFFSLRRLGVIIADWKYDREHKNDKA